MVTRAVKTNSFELWWGEAKLYLAIGLLAGLASFLGGVAGVIYTKEKFDHAAINSGHAQYHPTTGSIEWRTCK